MKTVGVKYCGGCRCLYDRQARFHKICELCESECSFRYARVGEEYDVLLVLSGCTAQCADISGITADRIVGVIPSMSAEDAADRLKGKHFG